MLSVDGRSGTGSGVGDADGGRWRRGIRAARLGRAGVVIASMLMGLSTGAARAGDPTAPSDDSAITKHLTPLPINVGVMGLAVNARSGEPLPHFVPQPGDGPLLGTQGSPGGCTRQVTRAGASFDGGTYLAQAGFVEGEIFAVTYVVPPAEWPIRVTAIEGLLGTLNATETTTTEYSVLVWQGEPNTGLLVFSESTDGAVLPHATIAPGTSGGLIGVIISDDDPEPVIIANNGSNRFSVGIRIDKHHRQTAPGCLDSPDPCCNAFPLTDPGPLNSPDDNWLFAINCGSIACIPNGGWARFSQLPAFICRPSGDWMLRARYVPANCTPGLGACCLPNGTCDQRSSADCTGAGGTYQGDGSSCGSVTCTQPTGACCFSTGGCIPLTSGNCTLAGGTFQGANTQCGAGSTCPTGACCLPDGTCLITTTLGCAGQNGTYRGNGTACATANCPPPTGACCVPGGCLPGFTSATCTLIPDSLWMGPNTPCERCCRADFTRDGALNDDDLGAFIAAYFEAFPGPGGYAVPCPTADPPYNTLGIRADMIADCSLNDDDLSDYITGYFLGCD